MPNADDLRHMQRALELAARGQGRVEPNPMVGCVVVNQGEVIGEGWHEAYGGPHAEANALTAAGEQARGATLYVTLEPCCHTGKTPPCTQAVIGAGVARVVIATRDPFPAVDGGGVAELEAAGVACETGVAEEQARDLLAPYLKLVTTGRPWVIAKWAMTLDGKIAARDGSSKWISSPESREIVHQLRGRVDAVLVGRGTAEADDPLLTARPPGQRVAARVVLGTPPKGSRLVASIAEAPLLVFVPSADAQRNASWLSDHGAEVLVAEGDDRRQRLLAALDELGRRRMTNVLVEGGGTVLGAALDAGQIDEVHAFIAPMLLGGADAPTPVAGIGAPQMAESLRLTSYEWSIFGADAHLHGRRLPRSPSTPHPPPGPTSGS